MGVKGVGWRKAFAEAAYGLLGLVLIAHIQRHSETEINLHVRDIY